MAVTAVPQGKFMYDPGGIVKLLGATLGLGLGVGIAWQTPFTHVSPALQTTGVWMQPQ